MPKLRTRIKALQRLQQRTARAMSPATWAIAPAPDLSRRLEIALEQVADEGLPPIADQIAQAESELAHLNAAVGAAGGWERMPAHGGAEHRRRLLERLVMGLGRVGRCNGGR